MRKLSISCAALLLSCGASLFAQKTGVNTKNPQGALHVDAKKNNATTGVPAPADADDDFIVTNDGKVGIGILSPSTSLHIKGATPPGAIRIEDGNQGAGKLLVSNAAGVGTWTTPAVTRAVVKGVFPSPATSITTSSPFTGTIYAGQYITLGPGKWVVSAGITLKSPGSSNMGWVHAYLSTNTAVKQQTGFTHLGPAGNNTAYAGVLYGSFLTYVTGNSFISGNSLIAVTGTSPVTIYLLIEKLDYTYNTSSPQNYFYAVPVN